MPISQNMFQHKATAMVLIDFDLWVNDNLPEKFYFGRKMFLNRLSVHISAFGYAHNLPADFP